MSTMEWETLRTLKLHDDEWIRKYIVKHIRQICVADDVLFDRTEEHVLTPATRQALNFIAEYYKVLKKKRAKV